MKRGRDGAAALLPDGVWHELRPTPVDDVDPVGAGDAFNGAYLAARIRGADVPQALAVGCASGAAVAAAIGDIATADSVDP